nr:unnamed protein product [Callosobruchus chinensis]
MPPKKKPPVNVVVGTVSTRSTRRQSIVNIEIPKSKRNSTKKLTAKEENDSLIPTLQTQTDPIEEPKKIQQQRTSPTERKLTKRSSTHVPRRGRSCGSLPDSNKELLRILDDWTDEEGQDRTDTSSLGYTESESSVGPVNFNSGTDGLETSFGNQFEGLSQDTSVVVANEEVCIVEGIKEFLEVLLANLYLVNLNHTFKIEAGQTEGTVQECQDSASTDGEMKEKISPGMENEDVIIENTNSSSGMCVPDVEEQCIVEQNIIIEDSQEAKDDIQIECVTDDVIPTEFMVDEESAGLSQVVHNEMPQTVEDMRMETTEVTSEDTMQDAECMQEETEAVCEISSKECYDQLRETEPKEECVTNPQNDSIVSPAQADYEEIDELREEENEITQHADFESMLEVSQENYEVMEQIQQEDSEAFQPTLEDTPKEDNEAFEGAPLQNNDEIYTGQMKDNSSQEQSGQNDENYLRDQPCPSDETPQEYDEEVIQVVLEDAEEVNQETFEVPQEDTDIQSENQQEHSQVEATDSITVEENIQIVHEASNDDSNYVEEQEDETIVTGEEVMQEDGVEVAQYGDNDQEQFLQEEIKSGSAFSTAELERTLSEGMSQDTDEVVEINKPERHEAISNEDIFQSTSEDSLLNSKMAFLHLQGTNSEDKGMDQEIAELSFDSREQMSSKSLAGRKKKDEKVKPRSRHSKSAEPKPKSSKQQKPKENYLNQRLLKKK